MKKSFDAVSWMRKRREQIDKEDAGLSWEQKRQKTRESLSDDSLWKKLKSRLESARTGEKAVIEDDIGLRRPL